ncbi:MAG: hypothetical protein JWN57_906 [Frankiales bacterium]|jgi:hypothetical protein|nr:hypothetical protein [Frankiales bacterium]
MPLFRRNRPPEAVTAVPIEPGDRRLAWAVTTDGEPVVATARGLLLPGRERLAWGRVERAGWQRPRLVVVEVAEIEGTGPTVAVELAQEGDLPDVVHTRVTGSVAWSSHAKLQPAGGVRVVGRRSPGLEVLDWQLVFDQGTDPDDPVIRAQAQAILEGARRTIG